MSSHIPKHLTAFDVAAVYHKPLIQLVAEAHAVHLQNFKLGEVQTSQLLSIKTGGCPENCSYCPQSAHYDTGVEKQKLLSVSEVTKAAKLAKENGATRFCMGAAWREVKDGPEFDRVLEMVSTVKGLGLETCCTLGMLNETQAVKLKEAGLYAYNHNIDTSEENYQNIISTRTFADRIRTIENVRKAGMTVCTGGILGLGENDHDRASFIARLANFSPQPESVTINTLVPIAGTPLENQNKIDPLTVIRVIATARIFMPQASIRLSAGRMSLNSSEQLLAYMSGANSIFLGEKLLTSPNPSVCEDRKLFSDLGLTVMGAH